MDFLKRLFPQYAYDINFKYIPQKSEPKLSSNALFKSLFGSSQPKPVVTPPAPMPTQDDAQVIAAKKKKMAAAMQTSGRQSTILTDYGNSDKLGA